MACYRFIAEGNSLTREQIEQIHQLYVAAGWWAPDDSPHPHIVNIVRGSHCFLAAVEADRIIGMGRAISDKSSDAYIQDVTVAEDYRRRGIGSEVIERLVDRLRGDGISWIGVVAERNTSEFYEKFGFRIMKDSAPLLLQEASPEGRPRE